MLRFSSDINKIIERLEEAAEEAVDETTRAIVTRARASAPVLTSSLQQSIHAVLESGSDHQAAATAARRVNPQVEIEPPLTLQNDEPGVHQGIADAAASHAVFVHNGTGDTPARPFLEEAALEEGAGLEARLRAKLNRL